MWGIRGVLILIHVLMIMTRRGFNIKAQDKITQCEKKKVNTKLVYEYLSWDQFSKLVMQVNAREAVKDDFEELEKFRFIAPSSWGLGSESNS